MWCCPPLGGQSGRFLQTWVLGWNPLLTPCVTGECLRTVSLSFHLCKMGTTPVLPVNVGWNKTQEALCSATGTEELPSKHLLMSGLSQRGHYLLS